MILHCTNILKENLDSLKKMMRKKDYDVSAAKQCLDEKLKSFEEAIGQSLPSLHDRRKDKVSTAPKKDEKEKKTKGTEKDAGKAKPDSKDTMLTEKVFEVTELDKYIWKLRVQELEALHTDCRLMPIHQMIVKIEEYTDCLKRMAKVYYCTNRNSY